MKKNNIVKWTIGIILALLVIVGLNSIVITYENEYKLVKVQCACGETFVTGSTKKGDVIKVDICSKCHPYFTGKQKLVDTGGRVDKFKKRYGL